MVGETGQLFDMSPYQSGEEKPKKPGLDTANALSRLDDVEERLIRNLENRANRGEKLTAGDYQALKDLRQRLESRQQDILPEHIVKIAREVAEFFNRTVRTIRNWAGRGMPQMPEGYDLRAIDAWALQEGLIQVSKYATLEASDHALTEDMSGEGDLAFYQLEIKRLDSELKAIKLQRETGALISREQVEREWVDRAFEFKRDLLSMARRLSLKGSHKDAPALYEILRQDATQLLQKYARGHVDVASLEVFKDGE